jgi:hypothetical protein
MRLLLFLQGTTPAGQIGHHRAFETMVAAGRLESYHVIPFICRSEDDATAHWRQVFSQALELIRLHEINLLFFQCYYGKGACPDSSDFIRQARALNSEMIIITSCAEPFGRWLQRPPSSLRYAAAGSDLVFLTCMGHLAETMEAAGAKNILLMPWGACQERFIKPAIPPRSYDFDIIFIGSDNGGRNPFTPLARAGRKRRKMVSMLEKRYGKRFGLFGRNWQGRPSWQGPIPYAAQVDTARRSRLQAGGFPGSYATYYTSDRFYIALASGVPQLDFSVERIESLVQVGTHWLPYSSHASLLKRIDSTLALGDPTLTEMGIGARQAVAERGTIECRMNETIAIATTLAESRRRKKVMPPPDRTCFHPLVDQKSEWRWSVKAWRG